MLAALLARSPHRAVADAGHGIFGPDRILHRHRDRGMGSILGALIGAILIGLIRSFGSLGFPLFTEGLMLPVHGDRAGVATDGPVRQGGRMTELQAEQGAAVPQAEPGWQRSRYFDVFIALAAFAVLAILPVFIGSKALLDFVIRCSAFGLIRDLAQPAGGLHRMVSFGHGMFFGLGAYGFGLIMQAHRLAGAGGFVANARYHHPYSPPSSARSACG